MYSVPIKMGHAHYNTLYVYNECIVMSRSVAGFHTGGVGTRNFPPPPKVPRILKLIK